MKCQNCNHNDADRIFFGAWNNMIVQYQVCDECLENMWRQAEAMGQGEIFRSYAGWWPGKAEPRKAGEESFPDQVDSDMRMQRKLAAMRIRLDEAAASEDYEEAAKLRDRIAGIEREGCTYEY